MGLNTIHDKSKDLVRCFNETKRKYFKCELLSDKECRSLEVSKGLEMYAVTITVKVNGNCSAAEKDKVRIMGKIYQIITISNRFDNQEEFRKRTDYENFTGCTIIGLQ